MSEGVEILIDAVEKVTARPDLKAPSGITCRFTAACRLLLGDSLCFVALVRLLSTRLVWINSQRNSYKNTKRVALDYMKQFGGQAWQLFQLAVNSVFALSRKVEEDKPKKKVRRPCGTSLVYTGRGEDQASLAPAYVLAAPRAKCPIIAGLHSERPPLVVWEGEYPSKREFYPQLEEDELYLLDRRFPPSHIPREAAAVLQYTKPPNLAALYDAVQTLVLRNAWLELRVGGGFADPLDTLYPRGVTRGMLDDINETRGKVLNSMRQQQDRGECWDAPLPLILAKWRRSGYVSIRGKAMIREFQATAGECDLATVARHSSKILVVLGHMPWVGEGLSAVVYSPFANIPLDTDPLANVAAALAHVGGDARADTATLVARGERVARLKRDRRVPLPLASLTDAMAVGDAASLVPLSSYRIQDESVRLLRESILSKMYASVLVGTAIAGVTLREALGDLVVHVVAYYLLMQQVQDNQEELWQGADVKDMLKRIRDQAAPLPTQMAREVLNKEEEEEEDDLFASGLEAEAQLAVEWLRYKMRADDEEATDMFDRARNITRGRALSASVKRLVAMDRIFAREVTDLLLPPPVTQ